MEQDAKHGPASTIPLRAMLTVPFVVQVVILAGLIGYLSYRNGQEAVNNVAAQLRREIGVRIDEHLREFLTKPHQINQINANAIGQGVIDPHNEGAMLHYLRGQIGAFDSVTSSYFGNTEGGLVDAGREGAGGDLYVIVTDDNAAGPLRKYAIDSHGQRGDLLMTVPGFDARVRPWYVGAVEKGSPTWTDVYVLFAGDGLSLAASQPVYDAQQRLLGVVSSDIFLAHMCDFLQELDIGETGLGFIFEPSGLLVATSTGEGLVKEETGGKHRHRQVNESPTPVIRAAGEFLRQQVSDYRTISDRRQYEFLVGRERQFLQVSPFRDRYGIDWLVAIVIPEADFMGHIEANNRTTAILVVVSLIVAILGGVATTRAVSGPILQLSSFAKAMARGDWPRKIAAGRITEISSLVESFDHMSGQLAKTFEDLTSEVEQRKRAENRLAALNECLLDLSTDSQENIDRLTTFCGEQLGATCALFNCLQRRMLCSIGQWHTPADYNPNDKPDGHICYDVIAQDTEQAVVVRGLLDSAYAETDPNVRKYELQTYMGHVVRSFGKAVGSVCVVFQRDIVPSDDDKRLLGIVASAIGREAERERSAEVLRTSRRQFRDLADMLREAVFETDETLRVTYANRQAYELFGYSKDEFENGLSGLAMIAPKDRGRAKRNLVGRMPGEQLGPVEYCAIKKGGDTFPILLQSSAIIHDDEFQGLRGIVIDISERKRLEEQLRHSEKMEAIGQLAGGIAHDFNNQLAGIMGHADMLRTQLRDEKQIHHVERILRASRRSADLTAQLLAFSRKGQYQDVPVDIHKTIAETIALLEHSIDRRITVKKTLGANPPFTVGDPTQLQNALLNLAINARDAMPEGGDVLFATRMTTLDTTFCGQQSFEIATGDYLAIEVSDTGCGMSDETMQRMFEPFFTTKHEGTGTGMGLAAVYGTVLAHKGGVTCHSEIGQGTTFTVYLPKAEDLEQTGNRDNDPAVAVASANEELDGRILVVDDEDTMRELANDVLEELGYTVVTCGDGAEALCYYRSAWRAIDLVILDMIMPALNGRDTFIAMREINPNVKAILSSGYSLTQPVREILNEGVMGFVQKPFRIAELADKVREVLEQPPKTSG